LAASPNIATAGYNPFPDLLFSPRAAFIWDHTRQAVTWMNAAARSKSGLAIQDLQTALPGTLIRRFAQCFAGSKGKQGKTVKLRLGALPVLDCSLEVIELAGGHRGLVVAEAGPAQDAAGIVSPSAQSNKTKAKLSGSAPAAATRAKKPSKRGAPVPQLTPEELRAFRAIGRTVRRLAEDKRRASSSAKPSAASIVPLQSNSTCGVQAVQTLLFSAFDLVLLLDKNFSIVGSEGRPQRLGWRKSSLLGKPAAQLLLAKEQAIFDRLTKKLSLEGIQICRDSLVVSGEAGGTVPCRIVLGRWPEGGAQYFLALLSLSMPSRLKRLQPQADTMPHLTRLAA